MSDEKLKISSICPATNWWFKIRLADSKKVLRRLPIAMWTTGENGVLEAICFDAGKPFRVITNEEDEDTRLEHRFQFGAKLKQIGDGIVYDHEMPKLISHNRKK